MEIDESFFDLQKKCEKLLGTTITKMDVIKRSIDARKKNDIFYSCTIDCEAEGRISSLKGVKWAETDTKLYTFPEREIKEKIVIAGAGPAGLFAALCLARAGSCPVVIERGSDVDVRAKKVNHFFSSAFLDTDTNVQFGEGGAGTFSDGKLNTGVNDVRIRYVLNEFVRFGAPENILYDSAPHIGTDVLRSVVKNIRSEIIKLGGSVRFNTKLEELICENGRITGIKVSGSAEGDTIACDRLILAIGHSARDTIRMLYKNGLEMNKKPFSIGVRIEHKQKDISRALYGKFADKLPAAPYKLWTHLKNGNSLYTFCMCPGGYVINSASNKKMIVTNGMSNNSRSGENANSALLVNVHYSEEKDIFEGMKLQEKIEREAYIAGEESYKMPVQLLGDFMKNIRSTSMGSIEPTVKPGYVPVNISEILPGYVTETIKEGIADFDRKIRGFSVYDAVLTAPETRSSSPIKIIRDKTSFETNIKGVYSAGEGGGHSGGITSSAVDGIKVAEAIAEL